MNLVCYEILPNVNALNLGGLQKNLADDMCAKFLLHFMNVSFLRFSSHLVKIQGLAKADSRVDKGDCSGSARSLPDPAVPLLCRTKRFLRNHIIDNNVSGGDTHSLKTS